MPSWSHVIETINKTDIYNISILDNIMSWNQYNLDVVAIDYYGTVITYRELPSKVEEYVSAFKNVGIKENDVVTLCLPVGIENVLSLFALNNIGAISNNPNFLFLRNDLLTYTRDKDSKILITLDAYFPFIIDKIEESGIHTVILTSLQDYLPNNNKNVFDDTSKLPDKMKEIFDNPQKVEECLEKIKYIKNIKFLTIAQAIAIGKKNKYSLYSGPVDINRDVSYSYTSGTTGNPKCIVYKEKSANAFIEMHIGINTKDYVGDRCLTIIPFTHATGERLCCYLSLAKGKTIVPQPIYNKESFGDDLARTRCQWVVAAPSFYLAGVAKGVISPKAFINLTRPSSGGEAVTKSNVVLIDRWLKANGCSVRFSIGGGAAEDGSGTIFTYFMDEETKTNETGHPLKPHIKVKLVDEKGNLVSKGQRGYLHVSSPAAADRYLNNEFATQKRWYTDDEATRWGVTGDIAIQNNDGSYSILGRADDSYIDKDGNTIFLFDIEYSLETEDPVIEWEISTFFSDNKNYVVGQVILKKGINLSEAIEMLCNKYKLDAVKIYNKFESSEVTGKRDYAKLKSDTKGYYGLYDSKNFVKYDFTIGGISVTEIVPKEII